MNPTGQPFQPPFAEQPPPQRSAKDELNVPSILLLISAGAGVLFGLWGLVMGGGDQEALNAQLADPNLAPMKDFFIALANAQRPISGLSVLVDGFVIFGALQMRALKFYPLVIASLIVGFLPRGACCCCLTLPVGIWALVVLMRAEVKSQFS